MKLNLRTWLQPAMILISLSILAFVAPAEPIDPWNLLSPKKIATMILALAIIQAFGSLMAQFLGARTGAILTGVFGGFVSSTATTAALAKKSKASVDDDSAALLTFLAATGAMLFEGLVLVIAGTTDIHFPNLLIFIGPLIATVGMIAFQYRAQKDRNTSSEVSTLQLLPILKLSFFIVTILSVSKVAQSLFGQNGLLVVTSLVSLFEIHGSVIANVQLHGSGVVSVNFLSSLLAISVVASYLSKLFLISTLGSKALRSVALKSTIVLFCSLALSWAVAMSLSLTHH